MKSSDITVGTDYLFTTRIPRSGVDILVGADNADRARTISAPVDGYVDVEVFYDGSRSGGTQNVPVRYLAATWADHLAAKADREARKADEVTQLNAAAATVKRLVGKKRFKRLPYGFEGVVEADGSYAVGGRLDLTDLADLLQAAYRRGRADESAVQPAAEPTSQTATPIGPTTTYFVAEQRGGQWAVRTFDPLPSARIASDVADGFNKEEHDLARTEMRTVGVTYVPVQAVTVYGPVPADAPQD